jgi:hypothetical protein
MGLDGMTGDNHDVRGQPKQRAERKEPKKINQSPNDMCESAHEWFHCYPFPGNCI